MLGVNIGVPAPVAWFPFSGWKDSLDGDLHANGPDAQSTSTPGKGRHRLAVGRVPSEGRCPRRTSRSSGVQCGLNRRDLDAVLEACDLDIEWHQITRPDRAVYRGHQEFRDRFITEQLIEQFADFRIDVEEFVDAGITS